MMVVQLQKLLRMKLNIPGEKQVSFQRTECPLHVSECEMSHLLAWSPESVLNFILVNQQLSQKDIPWPVSHDCIVVLGVQVRC